MVQLASLDFDHNVICCNMKRIITGLYNKFCEKTFYIGIQLWIISKVSLHKLLSGHSHPWTTATRKSSPYEVLPDNYCWITPPWTTAARIIAPYEIYPGQLPPRQITLDNCQTKNCPPMKFPRGQLVLGLLASRYFSLNNFLLDKYSSDNWPWECTCMLALMNITQHNHSNQGTALFLTFLSGILNFSYLNEFVLQTLFNYLCA